jgi:hypothetical protein
MLHMNMAQLDMVEEKLFLRSGEVLILVSEDLHIKDLREVVGWARGTCTIGSA